MALKNIIDSFKKNPIGRMNIRDLQEEEDRLKLRMLELRGDINRSERDKKQKFMDGVGEDIMKKSILAHEIKQLDTEARLYLKNFTAVNKQYMFVSNLIVVKKYEQELKKNKLWEKISNSEPNNLESMLLKTNLDGKGFEDVLKDLNTAFEITDFEAEEDEDEAQIMDAWESVELGSMDIDEAEALLVYKTSSKRAEEDEAEIQIMNAWESVELASMGTDEAETQPIYKTSSRSTGSTILDKHRLVFTKENEEVINYFIQGALNYQKMMLCEKIGEIKPKNNQIFVVHGHDEYMKETVARTLGKLNLEPIILHEQENLGKTIIEKFELFSENVSFAIILFSADDLAYERGQPYESAKYRARQNIILELGYFMGKLGRKKVVVLHKSEKNFEFPSDILGIVYIPFDPHNGWKLTLAKELKAAGYDVDFEKL